MGRYSLVVTFCILGAVIIQPWHLKMRPPCRLFQVDSKECVDTRKQCMNHYFEKNNLSTFCHLCICEIWIQKRNTSKNQPHGDYSLACLWYFWEKMIHYHVLIPSEAWDFYIYKKSDYFRGILSMQSSSSASLPAVRTERIKRSSVPGAVLLKMGF